MLLLGDFFFPGLGLHLLHVDGVGLAAAHVKFVVAHAEGEDPLVDADALDEEDEVGRLLVDGFDDEFAVVEGDVPDFRPGETDLRS